MKNSVFLLVARRWGFPGVAAYFAWTHRAQIQEFIRKRRNRGARAEPETHSPTDEMLDIGRRKGF